MAERTGGAGMFLAFVVGGLLVLVLAIGWMVWSGGLSVTAQAPKMDLRLPETPSLPAPSPNPQPTPAPSPLPKPG
ncbi:hypothetical protein [Caulobacter mirabilis]|uniref:Uncharacterized protein n=1 Tax=Caulobacter mirabilis TaxID=69666 RepID=A0A2D2B0J6_9CAUL|nr:hypothetical protein [Caulobacter mirabilis]ATQ43773.1 hypothetical protein CSW64_15910 [Caulobacter mirabilis]